MKKLILATLIIALAGTLAFADSRGGWGKQQPGPMSGAPRGNNHMMDRDERGGYGPQDNRGMGMNLLENIPPSELSSKEKQDISSLMEYEKLLRDLSEAYAKTFPGSIFDRQADMPHSTAFEFFLERYELDNPVEGMDAGEYKSSALENKYKKLSGESDIKEAVKNILTLTEESLVKVREARENSDNEDLDLFYIRLEQGLANRLASGAKLLVYVGESYKSAYLSQDEFDRLMLDSTHGGPGMMQARRKR